MRLERVVVSHNFSRAHRQRNTEWWLCEKSHASRASHNIVDISLHLFAQFRHVFLDSVTIKRHYHAATYGDDEHDVEKRSKQGSDR